MYAPSMRGGSRRVSFGFALVAMTGAVRCTEDDASIRASARMDWTMLDQAAAEPSLRGAAWEPARPAWAEVYQSSWNHGQRWSQRARAGALLFFRSGESEYGGVESSTSVGLDAGSSIDCGVGRRIGLPEALASETVLEVRRSADRRTAQFRCRMVAWGASRPPWVEPRLTVRYGRRSPSARRPSANAPTTEPGDPPTSWDSF